MFLLAIHIYAVRKCPRFLAFFNVVFSFTDMYLLDILYLHILSLYFTYMNMIYITYDKIRYIYVNIYVHTHILAIKYL